MDFNQIVTLFNTMVLIGCLGVGYIIKTSFDGIPNKYIPLILGAFGIVLNVLKLGFTFDNVVLGLVLGLASTGMHQMFKQFIEGE